MFLSPVISSSRKRTSRGDKPLRMSVKTGSSLFCLSWIGGICTQIRPNGLKTGVLLKGSRFKKWLQDVQRDFLSFHSNIKQSEMGLVSDCLCVLHTTPT